MKKKIALMVGHGTQTNGIWDSGCAYGSYTEAALMLKITKVAVKYLRDHGVEVITDADKNNNKNIIACVAWANREKVDYYMSVHCDYRYATAGVAPLYVSAAGKKMATEVGKSIAKEMGMKWKGAFRRTNLYELNATNMTSVILETGSIRYDLKFLKRYEQYGLALGKALCDFLGVKVELPTLPKKGYFTKGDEGKEVKKLQECLNYLGYDCGEADGILGEKTMKAIKKFKKKYGMGVPKKFGKKSLKYLKKALD